MMSKVIDFPNNATKMTKLYCEECEHPLEYWHGDDDAAYGICPRCDLNRPDTLTIDYGSGTEH